MKSIQPTRPAHSLLRCGQCPTTIFSFIALVCELPWLCMCVDICPHTAVVAPTSDVGTATVALATKGLESASSGTLCSTGCTSWVLAVGSQQTHHCPWSGHAAFSSALHPTFASYRQAEVHPDDCPQITAPAAQMHTHEDCVFLSMDILVWVKCRSLWCRYR